MLRPLLIMTYSFVHQLFAVAKSILRWPTNRLLSLSTAKLEDEPLAHNSTVECQPIASLDALLSIRCNPIGWHTLTEPFDPDVRSTPRWLGANYETIDAPAGDPAATSAVADPAARPKVLVCHDLAGNYRGDRFINGSSKWDDYRFYHWSGIDHFCYFSHTFVTVPPYGWIRAAHRNGVHVLGTVIFESAVGRAQLERILSDADTLQRTVDALVYLAKHCNFEGWLLNVEVELPAELMMPLRHFVRTLTDRMHADVPHALVIWYDSILVSGHLRWQNELNAYNRPFFDVSDGILLNYNWNDGHLQRSVAQFAGGTLAERARQATRVFVGIDVFGRGQVAGFRTAETLQRIRNAHPSLSVGIFAPGWTFEQCSELGVNINTHDGTDVCNEYFVARNNRFWSSLWPMLYTAGPRRLPFRSSFCVGSGRQRHRDGRLDEPVAPWFNLAQQSWQPSVPQTLQFAESFTGGSCLRFDASNGQPIRRLFVADFRGADIRDGLVIGFAFKSLFGSHRMAICLRVVADNPAGGQRECLIECGSRAAPDEDRRLADDVVVRVRPLAGADLRDVLTQLALRRERSLPVIAAHGDGKATDEAGWTVRYFYVALEWTGMAHLPNVHIADVGVLTEDLLFLGALHLHRGDARMREKLGRV